MSCHIHISHIVLPHSLFKCKLFLHCISVATFAIKNLQSGSKEEATTQHLTEKLYLALESLPELNNDIIIDDRTTLTIGRRYLEARRMGYPFIVVIGKKAAEEAVLFEVNDVKRNSQMYLNEVAVVNYIKQNIVSWSFY